MRHVIGLFLVCSVAQSTEFSAIAPNNRGVRELKGKNEHKAYQSFVEAATEDSFDPIVRLNLGTTFLANKENEKALGEFKTAEELAAPNSKELFMARFNQGFTYAAMNDIDKALDAYQRALEVIPNSKEAKTNIELLWQKGQGKSGDNSSNSQSPSGGKDNKGDSGSSEKKEEPKGGQGPGDEQKQNKQPKPFESQELTQDTVKKIMDELKAQEQRVRADHYSKGVKERPRDKEW